MDGLLEVADDSLARFLRSWYGEPDCMAVAPSSPQLPPVLRTWYGSD